MKIATFAFGTTLSLGTVSLLQHVSAQPIGKLLPISLYSCSKLTDSGLRHSHSNNHIARNDDVVTVVDKVYVQVTESQEVVVFVNQFGTPITTVTGSMTDGVPTTLSTSVSTIQPAPAPSTTSTSTSVSSQAETTSARDLIAGANPAPVTDGVVSTSSTPPVAATTHTTSSTTSGTTSGTTSSTTSSITPATSSPAPVQAHGYGFSYSPYMASGDCKTEEQVASDFAGIPDIGQYSIVRLYGTDCNQVATVLPSVQKYGLKLFAGIFDLGTLSSEIETIVAAAKGDWSSFDTISIGNELVNSGTASPEVVVAAIGTARGLLKIAGYTGNVVAVDTLVASRANPSLCEASDYCAVNCHPFFDGGVVASGSGSFLTTQIGTLQDVLSNKNQKVVVTETGWPWQGSANGVAVPSVANQAAALSSIRGAFASNPEDVILFTSYNDLWKTNSADTFNAEPYWGFLGYAPSG
jgi:exo-beta-1,3-glucanase (GH17 family)